MKCPAKNRQYWLGAMVLFAAMLLGCVRRDVPHQPPPHVRLGYFANLTHAQAVLGVSSGEFAAAIRPARLEARVFNAGPSLIEAVLANEIDIGYVGPGPALTGNERTFGQGIRVVSGAAANGVLIVAREGSGVQRASDLKGKRVATPQLGNTQDISARYYLSHTLGQSNLNNVLPIPNSEQAGMMSRGQIDAAWSPEPWASVLVSQVGAHVVAPEKDLWPGGKFALTLVITTPEFLKNHPEVVSQILRVHHHWTLRLQQSPEAYVPQVGDALFALTGKRLRGSLLSSAIKNVTFTDDPMPDTLRTMANWAYDLDFARRPPHLAGLIDTQLLNAITNAAPQTDRPATQASSAASLN
ncbi:MAG TPA: aliphatic sulfonate ABC transporter substrate-binding protein [Tepidisphaeraceae bacterium]|nr:aliphatic sulfonate ABC transporter substrate-binding protein [Tepidisphaeraceae bacterium]